MLNKRYKKLLNALAVFVIGSCAVLFVYMTIFRWADYAICIQSMAGKADVSPSTMDGIESYILETASPGMEREDVLKVLEKLGPVDVAFQSASYPPDEFRDTIFIESCMHPLNNLQVYAFYSSDSRLISISLIND